MLRPRPKTAERSPTPAYFKSIPPPGINNEEDEKKNFIKKHKTVNTTMFRTLTISDPQKPKPNVAQTNNVPPKNNLFTQEDIWDDEIEAVSVSAPDQTIRQQPPTIPSNMNTKRPKNPFLCDDSDEEDSNAEASVINTPKSETEPIHPKPQGVYRALYKTPSISEMDSIEAMPESVVKMLKRGALVAPRPLKYNNSSSAQTTPVKQDASRQLVTPSCSEVESDAVNDEVIRIPNPSKRKEKNHTPPNKKERRGTNLKDTGVIANNEDDWIDDFYGSKPKHFPKPQARRLVVYSPEYKDIAFENNNQSNIKQSELIDLTPEQGVVSKSGVIDLTLDEDDLDDGPKEKSIVKDRSIGNDADDEQEDDAPYEKERALPDFSVDDPMLLIGLPTDTFVNAKNYPPYELAEDVITGKRDIYIYVAEVHSPFKFWFNMDEGTNCKDLDLLMGDLDYFYRDPDTKKEYKMHPSDVLAGRACAACFYNRWHRGEIVGSFDAKSKKAKIFFIDYGTTSDVSIEKLCHLPKKFAQLPRQACRGRLALVAPIANEDAWRFGAPPDTTACMLQFVTDQHLYAKVYAYEESDRILHLMIYDVNARDGPQCINEKLGVYEFARYLSPATERFPHNEDLYPTFDMLEKGASPSYAKLVKIRKVPPPLPDVLRELKRIGRSRVVNGISDTRPRETG